MRCSKWKGKREVEIIFIFIFNPYFRSNNNENWGTDDCFMSQPTKKYAMKCQEDDLRSFDLTMKT